jgi:hypothetical protein
MDQENEKEPVFTINISLSKINFALAISCVLLSFFTDEYAYLRTVYNCLFTILVYNNLVFVYILYVNREKL